MAMSSAAEIEAFLTLTSTVSITYLDELGRTCAANARDRNMVRLARPTLAGRLITIRIDAAESEPVIARLLEDGAARVLS